MICISRLTKKELVKRTQTIRIINFINSDFASFPVISIFCLYIPYCPLVKPLSGHVVSTSTGRKQANLRKDRVDIYNDFNAMKYHKNLYEIIEKGMTVAANKPDMMPDQADEQIESIYQDIQYTLRVPVVNLIFRILANYPDYLEYMWEELSLVFRTKAFEKEADLLREKALLKQVPGSSEVNWEKLGDLKSLRAFNDTIYYVLPKLLLITTLFNELSFGNMMEVDNTQVKEKELPEIPLGIAEGIGKVQMVNPDKASERVKRIFSSIKEKHGYPLVSSYYRGIANWPDFLEEAWNWIKAEVGSSSYEGRKQELVQQAVDGVFRLSVPKLEKPKISQEENTEIMAILSAFQYKFIPEMLIDIALIKAMLDGEKATPASQFSVAD